MRHKRLNHWRLRTATRRAASLLVALLFVFAAAPGAAPAGGPTGPALRPLPADSEATAIRRAALRADGRRILVSLEQRRLWLLDGADTLFTAPVAVGMNETYTFHGRTYHFATPTGVRTVLRKETDPVWTPPLWHYLGKADRLGLTPVKMERGIRYGLSDGSYLVVRGGQVGRVNRFGNFYAWTPGMEIIFDGKLFIPPFGTAQRDVPNALGSHALAIGNGYLIHGTHEGNRDSVGTAASHGCIRMYNEDVEKLFGMVDVGTKVYIY